MLIIVQELDALAAKYSENQKSALWSLSSNLPWPVVLCGVSCSICLLVSTVIGISGSSSVVVGILLLLILALNISAHIWSEGQKRKNITNKLTVLAQVIRDALEDSSFVEILEEFVLSVGVGGSSFLNSASYSHLYNPQYDKAVLFPTSLVATDDIIGLCVGQSSPCAVACHQDSCIQLSKGDTVNLDDLKCYNCSDPSSLHKFKVLKSPIIEEIQDCLETKAERTKPSKSDLVFYRKIIIRNIVLFLIPLLLVISIVISCVWYMLVPSVDTQGYLLLTLPSHVFSVAIVPTCLLILPILPIMWPIIWATLVAIGEAKTVAPTLDKQTRRTCFNKWQDILPDILFGRNSLLYSGSFEALATLTVLCCVNKEGILSWPEPAPEKIFFLNKQDLDIDEDTTIDSDNELDDGVAKNPMEPGEVEPRVEILSLSQDTQHSNKLHFDDLDWVKYLASLKPIGLNILVSQVGNSLDPSVIPVARNKVEQRYYSDVIKRFNEHELCQNGLVESEMKMEFVATYYGLQVPETLTAKSGLSSFSRLIGFSEDMKFLYLPKGSNSVYRPPKPSQDQRVELKKRNHSDDLLFAHGVVVSHSNHGNHLLVSGSGDLVLQLCQYYWNGEEIQKFSDSSRKKVLDFHHRSAIMGHCVGFSCQVVQSDFNENKNNFNEIKCDSDEKFPCDQIFLGMLSVQYQARLHIFQFVEALEEACIRFVHFSPEDELRSRVFAEKMGLEVGWNCHISLSSYKSPPQSCRDSMQIHVEGRDDHDDELSALIRGNTRMSESSISDSEFHAQNRAKLPRGVENIVPHIESVDNVPLLVPLFTDCTHDSSRKMIAIMQKYGEVVCCVGSSDSIKNITVFDQANVSIAVQPMEYSTEVCNKLDSLSSQKSESKTYFHPSCTLDAFDDVGSSRRSTTNIAMETARKLNTFPCSVALSGDTSLMVIYNMIRKARHFNFLINVSMVFYMKCLSMISLVQIFSHVTYFPPIFTAADVFWLIFIQTPILSFTILASPADPDLMTWASIKNSTKNSNLQLFPQNLLHFCTKFVPSSIVVVLVNTLCILSICTDLDEKLTRFTNNSEVAEQNRTFLVQCRPLISVLVKNESKIPDVDFVGIVNQKYRQSQQLSVFILFLYMCIISSTYIQRWKLLKHQSPFRNKPWIMACVVLLVAQTIYSAIVISINSLKQNEVVSTPTLFFGPYQWVIYLVASLWTIVCFASNEAAKWREISDWTRSQKRARLEFGTKLGMNSPF